MSVKFVPVQWNLNKYAYDAVLILFVGIYILAFIRLGAPDADFTRPVDGRILRIRAFGTCAFFMLSFILCIGPLARLDKRFLPLLYNRRHFGVLTAGVAFVHATHVFAWYFNFTPLPRYEMLISANTSFGQLLGFPIEALGIFALGCLLILAATSHDFWLSFLGAPVWKQMHLLIYPAYMAVVAHVALGYLQDAKNPAFAILFAASAGAVAVLHIVALTKQSAARAEASEWVDVGKPTDIAENRARIIVLSPDERVAIFRYDGKLSAVSNACAHQNGPLGEGRIIDGCITCPWHGFQYRMNDGRSPEPFTETIPTYQLRHKDGRVEVNRNALPPGTHVDPLEFDEATA